MHQTFEVASASIAQRQGRGQQAVPLPSILLGAGWRSLLCTWKGNTICVESIKKPKQTILSSLMYLHIEHQQSSIHSAFTCFADQVKFTAAPTAHQNAAPNTILVTLKEMTHTHTHSCRYTHPWPTWGSPARKPTCRYPPRGDDDLRKLCIV